MVLQKLIQSIFKNKLIIKTHTYNFWSHLKFVLISFGGILILNGCNENHSINGDYNKELSGDYFYSEEAHDMKDILSHLPNKKEIYSTVLDYVYNSDFIIAIQQPNYDSYKSMVAFYLRDNTLKYLENSTDNIIKSEPELIAFSKAISITNLFLEIDFRNRNNYWIISHRNNIVYGPLTKKEYLQKREELKVPKGLDLDQ